MGCFTTLLIIILIVINFIPELRPIMDVQGFWMMVGIIWFAYFISWLLIGDLADEISELINTEMIKLLTLLQVMVGSFALKKAGLKHKAVGYSEILPDAIKIYDLNHPGSTNGI